MSLRVVLIVMGLAFVSIHCAHRKPQTTPATEMVNWHGKMHVLSESLTKLMPLTVSQRAFDRPENRKTIDLEVKNIRAMAHAVDLTKHKPTHDPALSFMAQRFASEMDEAAQQIEEDNRIFARHILQQTTRHCISCHTRTSDGRSNMQLSAFANMGSMSKMEQANFAIAMRDYDKALELFDQLVNSPDAQIQSPYELELAAEKALAVAVRVKQDPALADEMVSRIADARWAPVYLRLNALVWKSAIKEWRAESSSKALTARAKFASAKRIMTQGWKKSLNSPLGQAGLVHFLRASQLLHELAGQSSNQPEYGEYLYYSGLAAESLRDMNLWTLQDSYYEACVRHSPRTPLAKKCYLRLEALKLSAYATDEGARLPRSIRERLFELRNLSENPNERFDDWHSIGE
ncbi:MAG: hypothetical protein AB7N80_04830 [Bdellovibrionales bacterium]